MEGEWCRRSPTDLHVAQGLDGIDQRKSAGLAFASHLFYWAEVTLVCQGMR